MMNWDQACKAMLKGAIVKRQGVVFMRLDGDLIALRTEGRQWDVRASINKCDLAATDWEIVTEVQS